MNPRNSKGQFTRKRKWHFRALVLLLILIPAVMYFFSLPKTYNQEQLPDLFPRCEKVSPVPCDELYGLENFSEHLDKVENPEFWKKPLNHKDKQIQELKNQLNQRWDSMTTEEKILMVFGEDGEIMIEVAMCESGMNPLAENPNSSATGLFQILSQLHQVKKQWLKNPDTNMVMAKQLFDASGTNPWNASKHCWGKSL
jgi:hypothetical protein